jgi:hypothetical protein
MRIDAIAIGLNRPDDVNVIVEVPIGGEPIKYELDKAAATLVPASAGRLRVPANLQGRRSRQWPLQLVCFAPLADEDALALMTHICPRQRARRDAAIQCHER